MWFFISLAADGNGKLVISNGCGGPELESGGASRWLGLLSPAVAGGTWLLGGEASSIDRQIWSFSPVWLEISIAREYFLALESSEDAILRPWTRRIMANTSKENGKRSNSRERGDIREVGSWK